MKIRNPLKFNKIHVLWSDYLHDYSPKRWDVVMILTQSFDSSTPQCTE